MKNFIKSLIFGKKSQSTLTNADTALIPDVVGETLATEPTPFPISKELYVDDTDLSIASTERSSKPDNPFQALIDLDHKSAGYRDGYDFQDTDLQKNYHQRMIEQFREICKIELRKINEELIRLNGFLSRREELSSSVVQTLNVQIHNTEFLKNQLQDELAASEEGRGKIRRALLDYDRGFTEGFRDFLEASKLSLHLN